MRLGLLGGTFDPVHNGHLAVARAAAARGIDRVAFVPARRPPHKNRENITDPFHRFAMTALATSGEERLCVSAFEVARDTSSYTIDTVTHYARAGLAVTLIMGSDSLAEIETWRECRALLDLAGVMVYPRLPVMREQLEQQMPAWVRRKWEAGSIVYMDEAPEEVSSTQVRGRLKEGRPVTGLVPPAVAEYIGKHRLYLEGPEGNAD